MSEKFILTQQMHLGYAKDTFQRGAVIEYIPERNVLVIDGRTFQDTRDIDILKHRSQVRPDAPWVVPFSEEVLEAIKGVPSHPQAATPPEKKSDGKLPIVTSDEDSHQVIDIRHTQVGKRNAEAKDAARIATKNRDKNNTLEVIRGDQSVEERIEELKGKTDMASVSERVQLKRKKASMPVVYDDSLGMGVGRGEIPMNAGQSLPSREDGEKAQALANAKAASYKSQVDKNRKAAGVDVPEEIETIVEVPTETEGSGVEVVEFEDSMETPQETAREAALEEANTNYPEENILDEAGSELKAENEVLREENAELKETQRAILARLEKLESKGSSRPSGRPKGSKDKVPRKARKVTKPARTPVTSE